MNGMSTLDLQVQKEDGGTEVGKKKIFIVTLSVSAFIRGRCPVLRFHRSVLTIARAQHRRINCSNPLPKSLQKSSSKANYV